MSRLRPGVRLSTGGITYMPAAEIVLLVAAFAFLEAVLSYLLYKLRIREQPY